MKNTRRPKQEGREFSTNSEIPEIQPRQEVVGEQSASGLRGCFIPARPARYPDREQSKSSNTSNGDAAAGQFGAQEEAGDDVRDGDQRNAGCRLDRRRNH